MRSLLIVRTHVASEAALAAYDRYAAESGLDVSFVLDERRGPVDVGDRDKISMTTDSIVEQELFPHADAGWRCGDYFYYAARAQRPGYDRYYMIEPDVFLNMRDLRAFFALLEADPADMLLLKFAHRKPNWGWYQMAAERFERVFGCVYSFSRLSGLAIDALLVERRRQSEGMTDERADGWPNDESFTASAGMALGLEVRDFNGPDRVFYTGETFRNGTAFDRTKLQEKESDDLIYHPARPLERWLKWHEKLHKNLGEIGSRNEVSVLTRYGKTLLEQPEMSGAALIPLVQARDGWLRGGWEDHAHEQGEPDSVRAARLANLIKRRFGPVKDKPRVATVYAATSKVGAEVTRRVEPSDYELVDGLPLGSLPAEHALPYCWNMETRELLCTLHVRPSDVLKQPFLYGAQRKQARVVASVPLKRCDDVFGEPDPDAPFIFLLSIGRTGSTLFHSLLRRAVPRAISEPDTLTQLTAERQRWADEPGVARRMLWHSVSAFRHTRLDDDAPAHPVAIKTRSQVNGMVPDLVRAFPKAKFVFMTRERTAWARSTYRSFSMEPEQVAGRLLQGVTTIRRLRAAKPDATLLAYEDVVSDPVAAVETIVGRAVTDNERAAILATMKKDSQAGTKVGRDRTGAKKGDEEAWMTRFEEEWAKIRPHALMKELGLDL